MPIQGSIVLEFGEGVSDDSFVVVELDEEVNLDTEGNVITTFLPEGETAGFIVHFNEDELQIGEVTISSGSVAGGARTTRSKTESIQFPNTVDKVELPYIPYGSVTFDWYAENHGNEPEVDVDGREMLALSEVPGIGNASFNIICYAYTLTPPRGLELDEDETYPVLCVVTMEATV